MRVSARPMAIGANPVGALPWVAPMMTKKKHHRQHDFGQRTGAQVVFAGRVIAISVRRKSTGKIEVGRSAGNGIQHRGADDRTIHLRYYVGDDEAAREPSSERQSHGHRWIE